MTYVKRWADQARGDLRQLTEAVRNRVQAMAVIVASAPHAEQSNIDPDTGLRVRRIEGTLLEMHYLPDPSSRTVRIETVQPQADLYGDPYTDLV